MQEGGAVPHALLVHLPPLLHRALLDPLNEVLHGALEGLKIVHGNVSIQATHTDVNALDSALDKAILSLPEKVPAVVIAHTHLLVFVLLDAHEEGQDHIPRVPPHTRGELCDVTEDLALSTHLGRGGVGE